MAPLSPLSVHVTDQITAVLRDSWPLPLSTGEIEKRTGQRPGQITYRMLQRMAARGDAEKVTLDGMKSRYWRLARTEDSEVMAAWEALVKDAATGGGGNG